MIFIRKFPLVVGFCRLMALGLLCSGSWLAAQTSTADPKEIRTLEFTLLGWEGATPEFTVTIGGRPETISAPAFARSRVVKYSGPATLVFKLGGATAPGAEPATASVYLPAGSKRVTLLASKIAGKRYAIMAFPDDADDYPANHARILNLTSETLALNYNLTATEQIPAGKALVIPGDKERVILKVAHVVDGSWNLASEAVLGLAPGQRLGVILALSDASIFKLKYADGSSRSQNNIQVFSLPPWPLEPVSGQAQAARLHSSPDA
jgi:hypothetical protein